jgi:cobalt-zinc-cadmium efflux system membrane fusion protein
MMTRILLVALVATLLGACGQEAPHDQPADETAHAEDSESSTIDAKVAEASGIRVATAGPATIRDEVRLVGTVVLNADRHAHLKARFPGTVRAVRIELGSRVKRGQTLLVIEANESMRKYPLLAPFDGVVLARDTNVGDVTGDRPLVEIADLSEVWIELHALGDSAARIAPGQPLRVSSATTRLAAETQVGTVLPLATRGQSVVIRARLPNPDGRWRPGMTISGDIVVSRREVAVAVRESALQRVPEGDAVYLRDGDVYTERVVALGARDGEHAEIAGGLDAGAVYVVEQSFLIKAELGKSGAAHEH